MSSRCPNWCEPDGLTSHTLAKSPNALNGMLGATDGRLKIA